MKFLSRMFWVLWLILIIALMVGFAKIRVLTHPITGQTVPFNTAFGFYVSVVYSVTLSFGLNLFIMSNIMILVWLVAPDSVIRKLRGQ